MIHDPIYQRRELSRIAKFACLDRLKHSPEVGIQLKARAIQMVMSEIIHILAQIAEQEDITLANFACDLDVRAIASANDQATIEHEFHVRGAGGFGAGGGDVLADVGRGDDDLAFGDVVVFNEDDFEQVADVGVVVDY